MAVSPRLVVADPEGQILDDPYLELAGRSGPDVVPVPPEDLLRLPEGTKLFSMPGSQPVAWDRDDGRFVGPARPDRRAAFACTTVAAFLPPGYTRTLLPAAAYPAPPAPASALVVYRRRLGRRGLHRRRPPDRSYGSFRGRPLRRSRAPAAPRRAFEPIAAKPDLATTRALRDRIPLPRRQESVPWPVGSTASGSKCLQLRLRGMHFLAAVHWEHSLARTHPIHTDRAGYRRSGPPVSRERTGRHRQLRPGLRGRAAPVADVIAEAFGRSGRPRRPDDQPATRMGASPDRVEQIAHAGLDSIRISLNSARCRDLHVVLPAPLLSVGGRQGGHPAAPRSAGGVYHAKLLGFPRCDRPRGGAGSLPGPHPRDRRSTWSRCGT